MEDDPPYEITVTNAAACALVDDTILIKAVGATLRRHDETTARIHIALVGDEQIAELNARHLQHDGPTDVLSFDMRDEGGGEADAGVAGEIVVSIDTATREADERRHPVESELALYAVHGTLHLLGYDDRDESDAEVMHAMEDEILTSIGLGAVFEGGGR